MHSSARSCRNSGIRCMTPRPNHSVTRLAALQDHARLFKAPSAQSVPMDPDIEVAHITPHHAGALVGRDLHQQQPVWRIGFQSFRRLRIPLGAAAEVESLADKRAFGLHVALKLERIPAEAVIMTIARDLVPPILHGFLRLGLDLAGIPIGRTEMWRPHAGMKHAPLRPEMAARRSSMRRADLLLRSRQFRRRYCTLQGIDGG